MKMMMARPPSVSGHVTQGRGLNIYDIPNSQQQQRRRSARVSSASCLVSGAGLIIRKIEFINYSDLNI